MLIEQGSEPAGKPAADVLIVQVSPPYAAVLQQATPLSIIPVVIS